MAEYEKLEVTICLNKSDLDLGKASRLKNIYEIAGYKVIMTSAINHIGIEELKRYTK